MRLNIGAGEKRIPGYTGIDVVQRNGTDIVCDAKSIPLPDECADEVMAIHFVEHLYHWEVPEALAEWYRLLRPNGLLALEMPDILKACRNVIDGRRGVSHADQLGMWGIFGDPRSRDPFMGHRWGWTFKTLMPLVSEAGFRGITEHDTRWHSTGRYVRDFRLEAIK